MKTLGASLLVGLFIAACDPPTSGSVGAATAPIAIDVCQRASGAFVNPQLSNLLDVRPEPYCLDPNAPPRTYEHPGANLCAELSNADCIRLKQLGLREVNVLRYIHDDGSPAAVNVVAYRFSTVEGALAHYTDRVLANQDPATLGLRTLPGLRFSALGPATARAYRGLYVVEANYSNARQAPAQLTTASEQALSRVLGTLSRSAVNETLPMSVRRLPERERVEFGLRFESDNAFGVSGLGPAAVGYYKRGEKRYRLIVSEGDDPALARDVYVALRRLPGRRLLKKMPFDAFEIRVPTDTGAVSEWLVGKLQGVVVAVTDEPWVLARGIASERHTHCLDRSEKLRVLQPVLRAKVP